MRTRAGLRKRRALVRRAERGDHELLEVQLVGRVNSAVKHIEVRYQQARRQPVGGRHSGKTGCNVALAGLLTVHGRGPVGGGRCSSRSARVCQLRSSGEMTTTGQHTGTRRDPGEHAMVGDDIMFRTGGQTSLAPRAEQAVSFEVDHLDDALGKGWSVLVSGEASRDGQKGGRAVALARVPTG